MILASVQTANDTALPSPALGFLIVVAALILTACILAATEVRNAFRRAVRAIDNAPRQLTARHARVVDLNRERELRQAMARHPSRRGRAAR